jgi:hypothetical protein
LFLNSFFYFFIILVFLVSRILFTSVVLLFLSVLFLTYTIVEQVARVKSTARPMTAEELAAAGLPAELVVQNPEVVQPPEEHPSPAASEPSSHKDGEVRSDNEGVGDVDVDIKDLIAAKQSGPLPPSLVFGESKVTANMIRDYKAAGFFPMGTGCAPLDEQTPTP